MPIVTNEQQILSDLQDAMVRRAEQLVLDLNLKTGEGALKGKTQASKALEVAQTAGSLSVFVNWLRYQAGREQSADFWTRQAGKHSLARALAEELGWLQKEVAARLPDTDRKQQSEATMRATTRFLGYFRRALIGADHLDKIRLPEAK